MASKPKSRQELRDWCLRKLGDPILEINIEDQQIEDRITEALCWYQQYHSESVENVLLGHQITASSIKFDVALTGDLQPGETITGDTSGATARVYDQADDNLSIRVSRIQGTFQDGESFNTSVTSITGNLAASEAVTIGDIDNGYIEFGDDILAITHIYPLGGYDLDDLSGFDLNAIGNGPNSFVGSSINQFIFNGFPSLGTGSLIDYDMFKRHLALINFQLEGIVDIEFNRNSNRAYLDLDWDENLVGKSLLFEVERILDPTQYPKIYGDIWLLNYTVALLKYQWAWNLYKFPDKMLPGGLTVNAEGFMREAKEELEKYEEKLRKEFQSPSLIEIG